MKKQCLSQVSCVPAGWWEQVSSGELRDPSPAERTNGEALIGAGEWEGAGKFTVRKWKHQDSKDKQLKRDCSALLFVGRISCV